MHWTLLYYESWRFQQAFLIHPGVASDKVLAFSKTVTNAEYKENLKTLSKSLLNVPKNKPASFYEAILSIYICFSADPDSVGTLDRYLTPFYKNDIANGKITREQAKELFKALEEKLKERQAREGGGDSV